MRQRLNPQRCAQALLRPRLGSPEPGALPLTWCVMAQAAAGMAAALERVSASTWRDSWAGDSTSTEQAAPPWVRSHSHVLQPAGRRAGQGQGSRPIPAASSTALRKSARQQPRLGCWCREKGAQCASPELLPALNRSVSLAAYAGSLWPGTLLDSPFQDEASRPRG